MRITKVEITKANGETYIDSPTTKVEGKSLYIQGWAMSTANTNIKVYLDETEITDQIERYERADVINAIKGYGGIVTNPTPGFKGTIDVSNIKSMSFLFHFLVLFFVLLATFWVIGITAYAD